MASFSSIIDAPYVMNFPENFTNFSNFSNTSIDKNVILRYLSNRRVDLPAFYALCFSYGLLIVIGACGNSLVVCAVVRKPAMRNARNMFIVNLAISDLLLCLITMPLTLVEILTTYWSISKEEFVCKLLGALQAISIFVSSISITAIALDRYQVIVYPTRENLQKLGAVTTLSLIWVISFILASPMFIWRKMTEYEINLPGIAYVVYCIEEWPIHGGRAYYSLFTLFFQFLLPIMTVSFAYMRICRKLKYRHVSTTTTIKPKDGRRMKKINSLLVTIALIFFISWLPLNVFNLIMDLDTSVHKTSQPMIITYAICHMIGMSSACSNPLLYGWLNDNFRKEFHEILGQLSPCLVGHLWDSSTVIRTTTQNPSRRRGTQPAGDTFESRSELTQHRGLKNYGKSLHGLAADMNRSSLAPETTTTENGGNGNEVVETEMTKV